MTRDRRAAADPVRAGVGTARRHGLAAALFAAFALAHLAATRRFLDDFPYSWSWTEVMVDYQGGFVKRGLLGEVAFALRHAVRPEFLLAGAVLGAYLLAAAALIFLLRLGEGYPGLLFLFCPAGGLFPLLNPAAYGRKDAFVVAALAASLALVDRLARPTAALLGTMAVFAAAGLIVEISWFYYPLVAAALLARWRGAPARWRFGASAAAAAYTLACLGLTLAAPPVDTAAIAESWHRVPFLTDDTGALCCLNIGLRDAFGLAGESLPNLGGFALGAAAGLLPLAVLLARRPPRRVDALAAAAAAAAAFPLFVAADWGRYIYLWLTAAFLCAWTAARGAPPAPDACRERDGWVVRGALLLAYAATWQIPHVGREDRSAFMPGAVFRALGEGPPLPP